MSGEFAKFLETMELDRAPITFVMLISSVLLMVLQAGKIVDPLALFFDFDLMMQEKEYHRLITSFLYFGSFSIDTIFTLVTFTNFASIVESEIFGGKMSEFIVFLLYVAIPNIVLSNITNEVFFGPILTLTCLYYWSKHYADMSMHLMGIPVNVKASYAPFAYAALNFYKDGFYAALPNMIGIVLGHIFFYFHDVTTIRFGKRFIGAPKWLDSLCNSINKLFV